MGSLKSVLYMDAGNGHVGRTFFAVLEISCDSGDACDRSSRLPRHQSIMHTSFDAEGADHDIVEVEDSGD